MVNIQVNYTTSALPSATAGNCDVKPSRHTLHFLIPALDLGACCAPSIVPTSLFVRVLWEDAFLSSVL